MNILITNDDSIQASQLLALIEGCRKLGDVTVVVPKYEQSAKSHSIEIRNAFEVKQVELAPNVPVWQVDSTPADCVRFALFGLNQKFDLVISGINRGYNLGKDTMYSGTLAAATEAASNGIHAIALSTSVKYYEKAVNHLDQIFQYIFDENLWDINCLYNINIPVDPKGIRITRQGGLSFCVEYIPQGNDLYYAGGKPLSETSPDLSLDTAACKHGYISVTPMTVLRTNMDAFSRLASESNLAALQK